MNFKHLVNSQGLQGGFFLVLLALVTLAFGWILLPFFSAVFWAAIIAMLFAPVYRWLAARWGGRRTLAALATIVLIFVIVIVPAMLLAGTLAQEAALLYQRMQSGEMSVPRYFEQIKNALPGWLTQYLDRLGVANLDDLQRKIGEALSRGSQIIATQALSIGQNTFEFVISFFIMLYLAFFLLRDGGALSRRVRDAIPLNEGHKRELLSKFATVIRATVKGNVLVALTQGILGGLAFWVLGIKGVVFWTVLMSFLSLLPAVGAGLIWGPVAIYFLATGAVLEGLGLIAYGVVVIGLVDNVLRPVLVGKDTKMPDYVVLMSTIGGMSLFGINGFVIGPVIAAMFIAVWDIFAKVRRDTVARPDDRARDA